MNEIIIFFFGLPMESRLGYCELATHHQAQKQISWSAREAEEWLGKDEWKAWNQLKQIPLGLQRKILKFNYISLSSCLPQWMRVGWSDWATNIPSARCIVNFREHEIQNVSCSMFLRHFTRRQMAFSSRKHTHTPSTIFGQSKKEKKVLCAEHSTDGKLTHRFVHWYCWHVVSTFAGIA